jgi:hypothetical protein
MASIRDILRQIGVDREFSRFLIDSRATIISVGDETAAYAIWNGNAFITPEKNMMFAVGRSRAGVTFRTRYLRRAAAISYALALKQKISSEDWSEMLDASKISRISQEIVCDESMIFGRDRYLHSLEKLKRKERNRFPNRRRR